MNQSLWISKTGLDAQQTKMSTIANNLANVGTTGFKRGRDADLKKRGPENGRVWF